MRIGRRISQAGIAVIGCAGLLAAIGSGAAVGGSSSPLLVGSAQRLVARPATAPVVRVAPLGRRRYLPDLLVTEPTKLPSASVAAIRRLAGVLGTESLSIGPVRLDGHRVELLGVNPSSFRSWTSLRTARSDPLWRMVAAGAAVVSFDLGEQVRLPLGGMVALQAHREKRVWLAAFATVGVAGVDAVVATPVARQLGLPQGNGLLIAAPRADPLQLRTRIAALTGGHARVEILREVVTVRAAGEFLTNAQIATVLAAAHSRLDFPYLWGGTGPDAFDCSGLVGWAFAHAGVVLPRTSEQQWLAGPHVPPADLRPGDLLFYHYDPTDPADVDHVALYVGGDWMIEAPHTGAFVQEVDVRGNELAGIVRVDPVSAAEVGGPRFSYD